MVLGARYTGRQCGESTEEADGRIAGATSRTIISLAADAGDNLETREKHLFDSRRTAASFSGKFPKSRLVGRLSEDRIYRIIPTRLYLYPLEPAFGRGFRAFSLRFKLHRGRWPFHNTIRSNESRRRFRGMYRGLRHIKVI